MGYASPVSLNLLAQRLVAERSEDIRWRLLLGFLDEYRQSPVAEHASLIALEPAHVDTGRWDMLLAAVAEHLAYEADAAAPLWVRGPGREWTGKVWWVVDLPSARPWALAHSPAAFRRRGIFLHPDDLAVA
jgi:hypothetical protein